MVEVVATHGDCARPLGAEIVLIYARARNGVIGRDGRMPWHLPEDLAHFRALTHGAPVIMGRKTWDSLPARFRPLPGRRNIVISRDPQWRAEGAERAESLRAGIEACAHAPRLWVIGGGQIYAQALPLAGRVEVTEIDAEFEGDAFAPTLGPEWQAGERSAPQSSQGLAFQFVTYRRAAASAPNQGV